MHPTNPLSLPFLAALLLSTTLALSSPDPRPLPPSLVPQVANLPPITDRAYTPNPRRRIFARAFGGGGGVSSAGSRTSSSTGSRNSGGRTGSSSSGSGGRTGSSRNGHHHPGEVVDVSTGVEGTGGGEGGGRDSSEVVVGGNDDEGNTSTIVRLGVELPSTKATAMTAETDRGGIGIFVGESRATTFTVTRGVVPLESTSATSSASTASPTDFTVSTPPLSSTTPTASTSSTPTFVRATSASQTPSSAAAPVVVVGKGFAPLAVVVGVGVGVWVL